MCYGRHNGTYRRVHATTLPVATTPAPEPIPALIASEVTATGCVMLSGPKSGGGEGVGHQEAFRETEGVCV